MRRFSIILLMFLQLGYGVDIVSAQDQLTIQSRNSEQVIIPFEVSQNLIIVPVSINGSQTLKMVLDSGISNTIITELTGIDTLDIKYARKVVLAGLGSTGPDTAFASTQNNITVFSTYNPSQKIVGGNHDCYVLTEDHFSLSKQLGMQVNGLIGSEFFSRFIVEVNYQNKTLVFHNPETFVEKRKFRRYTELPITKINNKAFVKAIVSQEENQIPVNLMIDTGASLPLWIALHTTHGLSLPEKNLPALLGQGLNGEINGVNGRVDEVKLADFTMKEPLVSFPDSASVSGIMETNARNGSLGNDVLRRFHVVFDFPGLRLLLKPNRDYHDPFSYNQSGMEIEKPNVYMPIYHVYNVVEGSPAGLAGIKPKDQIIKINGVSTLGMTLDQINSILHGYNGNTVRILYNRDGVPHQVRFKLKDEL